jgi:heterodisulfide reductase subunit C
MNNASEKHDLNLLDHSRFKTWTYSQAECLACGMCSSCCPVSGIDGFDPRKFVRMVALGQQDAVIEARWPWICTMCARCENVCPMAIDIPNVIRNVRSLRDRDKVPGTLQKGVEMAMRTGNNLGLPKEDFIFIIQDVAAELAEEPGFEDFKVPIDKKGAGLLSTIHNKLVNTHTEDLKHWWKIFHAAGEDWTIPSDYWEGCSWGYFTGDDGAVKTMVDRIAANLEKLEIKNFLWCE